MSGALRLAPTVMMASLIVAYRLDWNDRYQRGSAGAKGHSFYYGPRTVDPEPLTPQQTQPTAAADSAPQASGGQRW